MDSQVIARLLGVLVAAQWFAATPLRASDPGVKAAVAAQTSAAQLLELGDRYTPSALATAKAFYQQQGAKSRADAHFQYAFALVLIRQHAQREAVELLDELLTREPDALHLWRAKIWAEMVGHKEREALADMRKVAEVLAKHPPAGPAEADAEAWRDTAAFLGRVFGFLEVPRTKSLPADEVRRAKQSVLASLGDARTDFERNEELVAERFSKVRDAAEDQRAKRVAAGKTKQEGLAQQKKAIDEAETSVDYDTEKVKTNTKTEVERLDKAAEMVNKNIMVCRFRLDALQPVIALNQLKLDAQNQNIALTQQNNPGIVSTNSQAIAQTLLINLLQRLIAEQLMITKQVFDLNAQLRAINLQREALLQMHESSTERLKTQAATLKYEEKRLEKAERTEAKKIAAEHRKTLLTKQTSFASFEPFPFDAEKQRLLALTDP